MDILYNINGKKIISRHTSLDYMRGDLEIKADRKGRGKHGLLDKINKNI